MLQALKYSRLCLHQHEIDEKLVIFSCKHIIYI